MLKVEAAELSDLDWQALIALKREFTVDEITENPWAKRAQEAGLDLPTFVQVAKSLQSRKVIGRFSTFLEHVKPSQTGVRVTRFNGLFHWAVPHGREIEAGGEVGKRLDFLIQELLREANTLGSKAATLELTNVSLEMKVAIEQLREQVQNIE